MDTMVNLWGRSVGRALDLAGSFSDALLDAHDLFSRKLDIVSSRNPFRTPSTPPGSRAHNVERHIASLETQLARPSGLADESPDRGIIRQACLCALKQVLAKSTLLQRESSEVFASVADFLLVRDLTHSSDSSAGDHNLLIESLRRDLLDDCYLPAPEVRHLLNEIRKLTVPLRHAA